MNVEMALGMVTGLIVGLILVVIILKTTKKDGKIKCQYDERQELARGKGFKYGFFTLIICDAIMGAYSMFVEQTIFNPFVNHIFGMFVGVGVFVVYCVWNDAYISLNENRRKVLISFGLIAIANFGIWIEEGVLYSVSTANLLSAILFVVIFIAVFVKGIVDKREE